MKGTKSLILVCSTLLFLLLFTVLMCSISVSFGKQKERIIQTQWEDGSHLYQYTETNPFERFDQTNFGGFAMLSIPFSLEDGDFVVFTNERDNQVIISRFGEDDYECQGSCSCSKEVPYNTYNPFDEERRAGLPRILHRGLFLTLSTFSVAMAYKISEKTFRETCVHHFSDSCPFEHIESEVTSCELNFDDYEDEEQYRDYIFDSEQRERHEREVKEINEGKREWSELTLSPFSQELKWIQSQISDEDGMWEYHCIGRCKGLKLSKREEAIAFKELGITDCSDLETSGNVKVKDSLYKKDYNYKFFPKVKTKFSKLYLTSFCRDNSISRKLGRNVCSGGKESVSCKATLNHLSETEKLNVETKMEKLFKMTLNSFMDLLKENWGDRRKKKKGSYTGALYLLSPLDVSFEEWPKELLGDDEICTHFLEITIFDIKVGFWGRGFFSKVVEVLEEWVAGIPELCAIAFSDTRNVELKRFLGQKKYVKNGMTKTFSYHGANVIKKL